MVLPIHATRQPVWPFWLLALAWFCASCPLASQGLIAWLQGASSFSHQERLHAEVARVLAGKASSTILASLEKLPLEQGQPTTTADGSVKKIELGIEESVEIFLPRSSTSGRRVEPSSTLGIARGRPPLEPPRVG